MNCNVRKKIWQSGISLAFIWRAKHKCQGTSETQVKTRYKDIKDKSIIVMPQLIVFWDKHITLRTTVMLSKRCSKKRMWINIKTKRLALRRGKQGLTRARDFILKTEVKKMFWEVFVNCQRMAAGENSILPVKQTFKSVSHEGRYFYQQGRSSLFLFCLHMQMFHWVFSWQNVKRLSG